MTFLSIQLSKHWPGAQEAPADSWISQCVFNRANTRNTSLQGDTSARSSSRASGFRLPTEKAARELLGLLWSLQESVTLHQPSKLVPESKGEGKDAGLPLSKHNKAGVLQLFLLRHPKTLSPAQTRNLTAWQTHTTSR